jgi:hypothetical protein
MLSIPLWRARADKIPQHQPREIDKSGFSRRMNNPPTHAAAFAPPRQSDMTTIFVQTHAYEISISVLSRLCILVYKL